MSPGTVAGRAYCVACGPPVFLAVHDAPSRYSGGRPDAIGSSTSEGGEPRARPTALRHSSLPAIVQVRITYCVQGLQLHCVAGERRAADRRGLRTQQLQLAGSSDAQPRASDGGTAPLPPHCDARSPRIPALIIDRRFAVHMQLRTRRVVNWLTCQGRVHGHAIMHCKTSALLTDVPSAPHSDSHARAAGRRLQQSTGNERLSGESPPVPY